jgi:hypothetical protein
LSLRPESSTRFHLLKSHLNFENRDHSKMSDDGLTPLHIKKERTRGPKKNKSGVPKVRNLTPEESNKIKLEKQKMMLAKQEAAKQERLAKEAAKKASRLQTKQSKPVQIHYDGWGETTASPTAPIQQNPRTEKIAFDPEAPSFKPAVTTPPPPPTKLSWQEKKAAKEGITVEERQRRVKEVQRKETESAAERRGLTLEELSEFRAECQRKRNVRDNLKKGLPPQGVMTPEKEKALRAENKSKRIKNAERKKAVELKLAKEAVAREIVHQGKMLPRPKYWLL